jgi:hypothetical protein
LSAQIVDRPVELDRTVESKTKRATPIQSAQASVRLVTIVQAILPSWNHRCLNSTLFNPQSLTNTQRVIGF